MSERVYKLLDGSELLVNEEALGVRKGPGKFILTISEEGIFDEVLDLLDKTVYERDRLRKELEEYGTLIEQQGKEMIRLQQLANKQGKELEEARKISFPRQPGGEGGWTINVQFLDQMREWIYKGLGYTIDTEQLEEVLLMIERISVGQEGEGNSER